MSKAAGIGERTAAKFEAGGNVVRPFAFYVLDGVAAALADRAAEIRQAA